MSRSYTVKTKMRSGVLIFATENAWRCMICVSYVGWYQENFACHMSDMYLHESHCLQRTLLQFLFVLGLFHRSLLDTTGRSWTSSCRWPKTVDRFDPPPSRWSSTPRSGGKAGFHDRNSLKVTLSSGQVVWIWWVVWCWCKCFFLRGNYYSIQYCFQWR